MWIAEETRRTWQGQRGGPGSTNAASVFRPREARHGSMGPALAHSSRAGNQ